MTQISNDTEFRKALDDLDSTRQRLVAARFVENVLALCSDERIARVVGVAGNSEAGEDELAEALKTARATTFACHTRCGFGTGRIFCGTRGNRCVDTHWANAQWSSLAGGSEQQDGADFQVDCNRR